MMTNIIMEVLRNFLLHKKKWKKKKMKQTHIFTHTDSDADAVAVAATQSSFVWMKRNMYILLGMAKRHNVSFEGIFVYFIFLSRHIQIWDEDETHTRTHAHTGRLVSLAQRQYISHPDCLYHFRISSLVLFFIFPLCLCFFFSSSSCSFIQVNAKQMHIGALVDCCFGAAVAGRRVIVARARSLWMGYFLWSHVNFVKYQKWKTKRWNVTIFRCRCQPISQ